VRTLDLAGLIRRLDTDGMTLPNGRALGATEKGWRDLLTVLGHGDWATRWPSSRGRCPSTLADLADEAFASGLVQVSPSVTIVLYPAWGTDEVWFDFSTRTMRTQDDVDALCAFVRTLGRVVGHRVVLSYEGRDDDVWAGYEPETDEFAWTD
jgi:hypothetical protein